jgi:nucleotide-binding universal stress UspA family protein
VKNEESNIMTFKTTSHQSPRNDLRVARISSAKQGRHSSDTSAPWLRETPEQLWVRRSRIYTVLVPLDGSQAAEQALPYAMAVARRSGAAIRLVLVQSPHVKPWQQRYRSTLMERLKRDKQAYLQSVVRRVSSSIGMPVAATVIESSKTEQSLCETATDANLVVMATRGRGLMGRLLHRSVSDSLMRTLPCPLLLVNGRGPAVDSTSDSLFRHVLIPLDVTQSTKAVAATANIDWLDGAQFTLVHFQDWKQTFSRSRPADPHDYLRSAAEPLEERFTKVNTEVLISDQPIATSILSRAEEHACDLIVLTTSTRSGGARLLNRRIANSVVRGAQTPVLVFPQNRSKRENG